MDKQLHSNLNSPRAIPAPGTILERHDERKPVSMRILCHAHGSFSTVYIANISCGGAAIRGCKSLMPGDIIRLEFLDRRQIEAKVRWWFNGNCGVQFSRRISDNDPLLQSKF